ncbi:hypothetical protein [Prescottella agglutinans]|uniref:hypothetical protein n=1 Tax=Prescottella agglutinans TaxID=1644129 RepID=UPI003D99F7F6
MSAELEVDPVALQQAAQGITGIIDSMSELGIGETAAAGRGFAMLALSPMEAGSQAVQKSFEEYAERWSWGVRHLVRSANEIAELLDLQAGRYHMMDQQVSDTVKTAWTHVAGNPHLTEEEISERSWGETFADNPVNNVLHADYSGESFDTAMDTIRTNKDVIGAVGPQALANVSPVVADVVGVDVGSGYHTGAAEQAASVMNNET